MKSVLLISILLFAILSGINCNDGVIYQPVNNSCTRVTPAGVTLENIIGRWNVYFWTQPPAKCSKIIIEKLENGTITYYNEFYDTSDHDFSNKLTSATIYPRENPNRPGEIEYYKSPTETTPSRVSVIFAYKPVGQGIASVTCPAVNADGNMGGAVLVKEGVTDQAFVDDAKAQLQSHLGSTGVINVVNQNGCPNN